ncbi:MAG: hypothetical protein PUG85_04770, partial [Oscillospiraceae bacterium]|nr:hypothetical protein [Oscillospiraceae bacterium]
MREINKKPFSVGLYIEGLRQLRIVGILGVILMFGSSLVINVSRALDYRRQATLYPEESLVLYPIDGIDAMPLLLIVFCAFAPIMVWMLFRFMNKRNSSDFMFAIPNTRLSIYCSYLSAIITWIAAMVLAGLIGVLLPAAIFSNYLNIMYDTVFLFTLSTFLCSLQVISVVLIAMSITGTFFSNIVLSGMLLFGPRLFIYMLTSIPESIPFICEAPNSFSFWSTSINPIFGFVFEMILGLGTNSSISTIFYSAVPMIYSVVLSVIYLLFAAFLFQRRKSETAGKSAPNPLLQAIYRIAITMLYCIAVAVIILFECNEMTDGMIFSIIVAYLIAVALYFLFELVMTKSLRKMWKAAPGLLIVLILNGVTIFGMRAAIHNAYQFQPTAEQVESISFVSQKIENGTYIYYNDYIQQKCTDVITDQKLISNILENLKEDKDLFENGGHGNYYSNEPRNRYKGFYFKIKTKSETRYRYIRIDPKTQRVLAEQLQQSFQNGNESWRIPPEPIEGSIWTYNDGGYNWEEGSEKRTTLFEQLKEELKTVDFLDWYDINHNGTETATFYFHYEVHTEDKETYQFNIPVYAALYPKTAELYNTYLYESEKEEIAEAKQFVETKMQNLRSSEDYDVDITAYYYDTQSQSYQTANISSTTFLKEIFENGLLDQPIGNTDSYADINIYVYYDEYTYDED